ncbi:MAG: 4Fe-4S dicluster domain-containing protein [Rhodococcus sp. (in: high G+C Gram-positive bacteria)]|nr:MAG: 4Fe-4S dicluster domain-containing protein [Rhodococcus sp. (in: high G+C Gram-positive bacteria)]
MAYVVTQPCCNEATCIPACPVDCIHPTPSEREHMGTSMLYIDPATCIDCGACADVCPVDAIVPVEDLSPENERFADLNAAYFEDKPLVAASEVVESRVEVVAERGPLRVAIVGSGPAGCYAAEELASRRELDVEVTLFERLPTPWGLVRAGVAPDHARTKGIGGSFQRTVSRKGVQLYLNVEVGTHITHDELLQHHHAILYATGASSARRLNIPGEDLPGSDAGRNFVLWYNGHPDYADLDFDLSCESAIVIGNGNVALDIARILTSDVSRLLSTDIADHALEALAASRIRNVSVVGRRGPSGAAFSTAELIGLGNLPGVNVYVDPDELDADGSRDTQGAEGRLRSAILADYANRTRDEHARDLELRFFRSPVEVLGTDRVCGIRLGINHLVDTDGRPTLAPTGEFEDVDCGLVLRSTGFRGRPVNGIPFDETEGTLLNREGRVIDADTGKAIPGMYTAGWIKRGSTGVIGTNRGCAKQTVSLLLADHAAGKLPNPTRTLEDLAELIHSRQPRRIDLKGWKTIDAHERQVGRERGRPRVKLTRISEMLDIAGV